MPYRRFAFALLLITLALLAAQTLLAQDEFSRVELGAQYSTIRETQTNLHGANFSGFGARFDWDFNRRLAFESQIDFFPQHGVPLLLVQGGRTFAAVFGIRAKVVQTRRISIFGLLRPGLLHFTDAAVPSPSVPGAFNTQPITHFVLNLGGGIEYYPSPRWILRADIEGDPYRVAAYTAGPFTQPGKIDDSTRLAFGMAYRLGVLQENERETNVPGNWEFGPLFSTMVIARESLANNVRIEPGLGGYASYRFYGPLYLDGDVLYFPRGTASSGAHDGGNILQGLVGIKGGIRRNHVGFFGKARPGFNNYSQALTAVTTIVPPTVSNTYARSTAFVLDLGGIVEFYPTQRSTLRIEVGDTHIYFGTRDVNVNGVVVPLPGGKMQHSIQTTVGYGLRF